MGLRDDFSDNTKLALAKRAGFTCSICKAVTVAATIESPASTASVGVAAHICAAAPGGPRYDETMTSTERRYISNAIHLCGTHAREIDVDVAAWPTNRLIDVKRLHEEEVRSRLGVQNWRAYPAARPPPAARAFHPAEYAMLPKAELDTGYAAFLAPILESPLAKGLAEIGVLLGHLENGADVTVFVSPEWLRWVVAGQDQGFMRPQPNAEHVLGIVPAWPDTFREFLAAIVETDTTFVWRQTDGRYPMLVQRPE